MTAGPDDPGGRPSEGTPARDSSGVLDSIRAAHGAGDLPQVTLDDPASDLLPDDGGTAAAARTPRYRVEREIARGGMGVVFRVRDVDLHRSLAMKVLRGEAAPGDDPARGDPATPVRPDLLARFLEEAQITAQLAHPGVVPVHELGIDAAGRVFFTMSLVRGATLDRVIALARRGEDGWTTVRALQVLLRVCETMAYAHAKGVIHRDLKPANVMVGRFGETYVMDWGLAKVAGQDDLHDIRPLAPATSVVSVARAQTPAGPHDSPVMTGDGAVVGTPAYMPPEQAEGRVATVDAQSDVYAIGAMLYELLAGQPPYVRPGSRVPPYAVLAAVVMGPPEPLHALAPGAPEELQAICEKAMARDRAQRYPSAAALADDLQRYLSGHVVRAHRTGAVVELRKWIARNRAVAATAAAALAAIAAVSAYAFHRISGERDRAVAAETREAERADDAEREHARAEDLAGFMLYDLRDGLAPIGRLDLLGKVARRATEYYEHVSERESRPDLLRARSVALNNVGWVLEAQGDVAGALASYRASLAIKERLVALDPADATWRADLAFTHGRVGDALEAQGNLDAALAAHRDALAVRTALAVEAPQDVARQEALAASLGRVGDLLEDQGALDDALVSQRAALAIAERLAAASSDAGTRGETAMGRMRIGDLRAAQGDLRGALDVRREALAIFEGLLAADGRSPQARRDVGYARVKVADALVRLGETDAARTQADAARGVASALVALDRSNTLWRSDLAAAEVVAGDLERAAGDDAAALTRYRAAEEHLAALAARDATNTRWRRDLAGVRVRIGTLLREQGALVAADLALGAALETCERLAALAPSNAYRQADLADAHAATADLLAAQDAPRNALDHLRRAVAIQERLASHDPGNPLLRDRLSALRLRADAVAAERR